MTETEEADSYRAEIALRNRRRALDDRERKLSIAVTGLMAYSAFANFIGGAMSFGSSPLEAGLGLVLGALYSLASIAFGSKMIRVGGPLLSLRVSLLPSFYLLG